MSLLRLALIWIFPSPVNSFSELLPALGLGIRYDLRIVCIAALVIFLLGSLSFLHPLNKKAGRRVSLALWGIFILLMVFFYVIDYTNYAYLSQRMNANLLNYLEDTSISLKMMWESYPVIWLVIGMLVTVFLLLWMVKATYNFVLSRRCNVTKGSRIGWSIAFFLLLAVGIFGRVGQFPLRWSDAYTLKSDYAANVALNPFQSFFSSLKFRHSTYEAAKVKEGYSWMASYLGVNNIDSNQLSFERQVAGNTSGTSPQNIVLVICESFSMYKSSMVNNPLNTTPFFNQLSKEGIFFERCFTPTYGTARGVWATITGVPDVSLTKTASRNPAAVDQKTIINSFTDKEKFYFLGGSTSWANIRGLLTNNIDGLHLYEEGDYKAAKIDVWGISDKNLFLEANKVLAQQTKPFFAVIQTADNHRPYTIPEEDLDEFKKQTVPQKTLEQNGFGSVDEYNAFRYTDFTFQKFIEAAKQEKYFENTLFVFVGDHGIRGDAGQLLPRSYSDQGLTAVHVPLLFYYPKGLQPEWRKDIASQLDILPTIAGIATTSYTNNSLGRNLLAASNEKYAFVFDPDIKQIGVVDSQYYYSYKLGSRHESFSSVIDDRRIKVGENTLQEYRKKANAFYESARYLLLNNKKQKNK